MFVINLIVVASWVALVVYWAVSAPGAKPSVGGQGAWLRHAGIRLVLAAVVVAVVRIPAVDQALRGHVFNTSPWLGALGAALCVAGVGVAIAARRTLGRNWGMPMTERREPELITGGPYSVVRHPIYSGLLLAMLGSALAITPIWLLLAVIVGGYYVFSALREEKTMRATFPSQYAAYAARTRMLVPYVF